MLYSPAPMHIPDGFLSLVVCIVFWVISLLCIFLALQRVNRDLGDRQIPLMGVLAAAIFAGQMLNFSVTGGTSGHLVGAAVATAMLGPWAAILVMTCVVGVQALIFQDGGILALGANLFNMAIVGVAVSYTVLRIFKMIGREKKWAVISGGFAAGWLSIFIASLSCALQLAISGTSPANIAIPAMAGIHALIGVGEGLITAGALAFVYATRKDLIEGVKATGAGIIWVGGLVIAAVLAILSPLASSHPDGLEWVAEQSNFIQMAQDAPYQIIPDYVMPGIRSEATATILAGIVGLLIVCGAAILVAYSRHRRNIV